MMNRFTRKQFPVFAWKGFAFWAAIMLLGLKAMAAPDDLPGAVDKRLSVQFRQQESLEACLQLIERVSGVPIAYDFELVKAVWVSQVAFQNEKLGVVLQKLLAGTSLTFKEMNGSVLILRNPIPAPASGPGEEAKAIKVSGTVSDKNGPLPGVSILVKNTTKGTTTDGNGAFTLEADSEEDVLVFSMIGYDNQEIKVGAQRTFSITLQESTESLSEVVVVGYGTQKKVNLTGAVSRLDAEAIEDRPITNLTQALQGAVPNLNVNFGDGRPGSNGTLNIRGNTSINGGDPLVLIDGVPGNLNTVNPRDVESISVLKDAASAAIYGARGAFGVVLVTTKTAKKGKVNINYSNNFSLSRLTTRTDFMTSGYDAAKLNDEAFLVAVGKTYTGYTDEDYEELLKRKTDPSLPSVVVDNRNGKDMYVYYGNTDWWSTMFRDNMPGMEHSLSFTGGNDKVDYLLSGRFVERKGIMQVNQDVFDGYNFRAKINAHVTPWLTLSSNTQFNASKYTYPGWGVNTNFVYVTVHALPSYLPVNPDGTATYRTELNNYTIGDGIYADLLHGKSKGQENRYDFINMLGATFDLAKGLNLIGNYTYSLTPSLDFNRRTVAPWSIFPGQTGYVGYDRLSETLQTDQYHIINVYGNYERAFGRHSARLTAGYNQELKKYKTVFGLRNDLLSEDLNALDLGSGEQQIGGSASEWALQGLFYRLTYDYAGKYLFEVNGRYDGTSRFPAGGRFGFFPSVSAGWRLSEEAFFNPLKGIVSELKVRASYGSLGNQQLDRDPEREVYPYIPVMNRGSLPYITNGRRTEYLSVPNPISPTLTWEKITSSNLGVDLGFLENRLTASFDWYQRNTKDMLTKGKTLPRVFGAGEPEENAADLSTKGWELALNWRGDAKIAGKPFSYNAGVALADYTSTITRFDNPSGLLNDFYVGQRLGEIWGYSIDGYFQSDEEASDHPVDQTFVNRQILSAPGEWGKLRAGDMKFADLNGDGVINNGKNTVDDHGDLRLIGNTQPRYTFGVNGGANWAGIDLSFFFQGVGRQHWYPGNNADKFWGPYSRPYYSFIPEDFPGKVWSPENPDAYFPRLRGYTALNAGGDLYLKNDRYLQNIAYVRLKNLTLGYSLPQGLTSKIKLNRCRVYFSGENLFTLTKLNTKYIDPEQAAADAVGRITDINARVYPFSKTYSLGLDITL